MAPTEETLQLMGGLRVAVDEIVDQQTRDLVQAWARSWDTLQDEWQRSLEELTSGTRWPGQGAIRRSRRTLLALSDTEDALNRLAEQGGIRITRDTNRIIDESRRWETLMIASQYPESHITAAGGIAQLAASFDKANPQALEAIVSRTTQQVTTLASRIGPTAYSHVLNTLVRGTAIGENPLAAARRMMRGLEQSFNVGLHRMNNIARTEMLDAGRVSNRLTRQANKDVLRGWQWYCSLDERTCPGCWSMHGQIFGLDTPGPDDHQQGRCQGLPATRSWKDLGFDQEEPASIVPDAQETFSALPEQSKLEIMGSGRLSLLDQGKVNWNDLATYRPNPNWRGSFVPTPLSALEK